MPARRRTAASSSNTDSESNKHPEDPAYKLKRKKNNEAVQRTREKTKKTAEDRKKRIEELKRENIRLSERIDSEKRHISSLREMIIQGRNSKEHDSLIDEILNDVDDEDDDDNTK